MVQTRWEHLNAEYSLLTRTQAMALDGHFVIEQSVRNKAGFFINFNGTAGLQGTTPIEAGKWYNLAVVYDPNDAAANGRLYVNGVQESSGIGGFLPNNAQPFTIGGRQGLGNYTGIIDELAFYNYALTANQISNHWSYSWVASAITQQPVGVTNSEWSTVSMTVAASGYPNTYQWYKVGTGALSDVDNFDGTRHYPNGVTNTTFTIAQAHPADSGQYYVVVGNALGLRGFLWRRSAERGSIL